MKKNNKFIMHKVDNNPNKQYSRAIVINRNSYLLVRIEYTSIVNITENNMKKYGNSNGKI